MNTYSFFHDYQKDLNFSSASGFNIESSSSSKMPKNENKLLQSLNNARKILRENGFELLCKLDYDEWVSLIFLLFDENNEYAPSALENINAIAHENFQMVFNRILSSISQSGDYNSCYDVIIEALYHIQRYDILQDDLKLCPEHSLHQKTAKTVHFKVNSDTYRVQKICDFLKAIFAENLALFQVFSSMSQDEANAFINLRLPEWRSKIPNELLEIKFLRKLEENKKFFSEILSDFYFALLSDKNLCHKAAVLKPFVWKAASNYSSVEKIHNYEPQIDPCDFYPMSNMEPYGLCVLINISNFVEPTKSEHNFPLETRRGSDIDRDLIEATFKLFGFTTVTLNDPDYQSFNNFFTKLRKDTRLYAMGCLAVVIMTHGDKDDNLYLSDRSCIAATDLRRLCYARALIGKPKMFFIQACRGEQNLSPMLLTRDSTITSNTETDCIVSMATVGKYSAMRSQSSGSWYIRDLCSTLQEIGHVKPLKTVLNQTRKKLSDRVDKFHGQYITQISEDKVTLTREIQLRRGEEFFLEGILDLIYQEIFLEIFDEFVDVIGDFKCSF